MREVLSGMKWGNPFKRYTVSSQRRALVLSALVSVVLLFVMTQLDRSLRTAAAPKGIISFELAPEIVESLKIMESWNSAARLRAAFSLGIDYLFLVVYALFISLACAQLADAIESVSSVLAELGYWLAWAQAMAALLDGFENYALARLLFGDLDPFYPQFARGCALLKFVIVGAGWAYILTGIGIWLAVKLKSRKP